MSRTDDRKRRPLTREDDSNGSSSGSSSSSSDVSGSRKESYSCSRFNVARAPDLTEILMHVVDVVTYSSRVHIWKINNEALATSVTRILILVNVPLGQDKYMNNINAKCPFYDLRKETKCRQLRVNN
ncbi:hypothetical protein V1478_017384 [Vespula squamosa]|uniref:Uncharacterized protein n=1 Tax=Vespula squamosa TaxID=30214 RepID=A0ABD1ZXU4_VESSQ